MSVSIIAQLKIKKSNPNAGIVIIRGYLNRKAIAARSLGIKINPEHWDPQQHQVISKAPNAQLLNIKISTELQKANAELLKKEIMGCTINRLHIQQAVKGNNNGVDFYEYCNKKISTYTSAETRRTYYSEVSKMQKFLPAATFNDIDYSFLTRYKNYMVTVLGNAPNTVWKSFKFLNTILNDAINNGGIISTNPFETFNRGNYKQTKRQFLTLQHCDAIEELTACADPTIRKVAIYCLLMAYSGMRFGDAMKFDPNVHVVNDERIVMRYDKMKTDVNNKMYSRLKRIVNLTSNEKLKMTNQKFNQWLKIIAVKCDIPFNLSSHIGRHTTGSLLARMGVSKENAKVILGHRSMKSTEIYYHQQIAAIDESLDKLNAM